MNACADKYQKKVTRSLTCCGKVKKELSKKLCNRLSAYLEECPNATEADLAKAFGPAEEVAHSLNKELAPGEVKQFRIKKIVVRVTAAILATVLLAFTAYILFWKEQPGKVTQDIIIID